MINKEIQKILHTILPQMSREEIEVYVIIPAIENILSVNHEGKKINKTHYKRILEMLDTRICRKEDEIKNNIVTYKNLYTREKFQFKFYGKSEEIPNHVIINTKTNELYTLSFSPIQSKFIEVSTNEKVSPQSKFRIGEPVKVIDTKKREWQSYPHWRRGYIAGECDTTKDEVFVRVKAHLENGHTIIYPLPESVLEKVR